MINIDEIAEKARIKLSSAEKAEYLKSIEKISEMYETLPPLENKRTENENK